MIKELLKYKKLAFLCYSRKNFEQFIKDAHKEGIIFSKNGYIETEEKLIQEYRLPNENDNLIALIVTADVPNEWYNPRGNKIPDNNEELQFYIRTFDHMKEPKKYNTDDWDEYKIFDYVKMNRKLKLQKINGRKNK